MATKTKNLNLEKPEKTEQYSVEVFNRNADKIDNFAGLTPPRAFTADKLTTGIHINDVYFDGTEDIKIETGIGINNRITNCLLEVPQCIKYTLQNGVLTLKAGSIVIMPYGTEDLTNEDAYIPEFSWGSVQNVVYSEGKCFLHIKTHLDIGRQSGWGVADNGFAYISNNGSIGVGAKERFASGDTEPILDGTVGLWYDTANNYCKVWNGTDFAHGTGTLPIMAIEFSLLNSENSYLIGNVNQVFNGFGYIGKTIWVDEGVKGLIPNGKKEDGTLNNIEVNFNTLRVFTLPIHYTGTVWYSLGKDVTIQHTGLGYIFDEEQNVVIGKDNMIVTPVCQIGQAQFVDGNITSFDVKQPVKLVTFDDLNIVDIGGGLEIGDIGIAPLGIDETKNKRRYLNGQIVLQAHFQKFTEKLKSAIALYPTLACTEDEWQTTVTMGVLGQCGKFVVDDEAGTIRLPRIIMPIQNLTDLSQLAEIVEAGLPDHQHSPLYIRSSSADNGGAETTNTFTLSDNAGNKGICTYPDSYSGNVSNNTIYGNSEIVQQEQIQYPYFIQVATGSETKDNIINEIELNNPFSLLDYKYSEYKLNNLSWLRSEGQFNTETIYPAVYELLVKIYNGTEIKEGVSVKLNSETFTDYDFVLNTTDRTFRLPIKVKLASGKAVVGNGNSMILTDGTASIGFVENGDDSFNGGQAVVAGTPVGTQYSSAGTGFTDFMSLGLATSGDTGIETSDSDLYLYFYVGETVQNANLVNIGRIEERLSDLTEVRVVTETFSSGTSWYRVYSDGWCEQGGIGTGKSSNPSASGNANITLLLPFANTNYSIAVTCHNCSDQLRMGVWHYNAKKVDSVIGNMRHVNEGGSGSYAVNFDWEAKGYII